MKYAKNTIAPPIGRFIDPITDFGFKRIFGSEPNKDLLIAFLNELFKGRKEIKDLVYNPQENNGPAKYFRKTIFDITCTGDDGETFIVEVPVCRQAGNVPNNNFSLTGLCFIPPANCTGRGKKGRRTGILS